MLANMFGVSSRTIFRDINRLKSEENKACRK